MPDPALPIGPCIRMVIGVSETDIYRSEEYENRFEAAREALRQWSLPRTDNAALIGYIDHLEQEGYRGWMQLEPEEKAEDIVFEVALAVGYECGLRDGETDEQQGA